MKIEQLTEKEDYAIRYSRLTDIAYLRKWLDDTRVNRYFPFLPEQAQEIELLSKNWIGFSKVKSSLTATYGCHPCGIGTIFLMPYQKVSHMGMVQIIVDPDWQKQGIGSSLIKNLKHHAKNYFQLESLQVELMQHAPAVQVFEKQGFKPIVVQEGFYKIQGRYEARVVLEVQLKSER